MSVIHINNNESFREEVLNSSQPVLVDFFASWCGPCRMLSPILDKIAAENPKVKVCKVDIDQQPELASEYRIMSVPTLLVFKEGEVVDQSLGVKPEKQILAMLA